MNDIEQSPVLTVENKVKTFEVAKPVNENLPGLKANKQSPDTVAGNKITKPADEITNSLKAVEPVADAANVEKASEFTKPVTENLTCNVKGEVQSMLDCPEHATNSDQQLLSLKGLEVSNQFVSKTDHGNSLSPSKGEAVSTQNEEISKQEFVSSLEEKLANAMQGRCVLDDLPPLNKKVVRIFLSSTFSGENAD